MASLSFDSHPYWNQGLIICSNLKMHENAMEPEIQMGHGQPVEAAGG